MWIFTRVYNNESNFENFIRLEIYIATYGKITINEIPCKVNKNSYKTVFVYDDYEINILHISKNTYKFSIYDISYYPYKIPGLKFGCELETCLDLSCTTMSQTEISDKLENLRSNHENKNLWAELIIRYISDVVIPYISEDFINIFPVIYIALNPKSGYVDYKINTINGIVKEINEPNQNTYITLTRDKSLKCDDKKLHGEYKDITIVKNTIHCEIITPTLKNIDEIVLLYNNIINPKCIYTNPSTSFHVNVSFNKDIYFSDGLIYCILEKFKDYESKYYRDKNKNIETKYATRIYEDAIKYFLMNYGDMIYYGNSVMNRYTKENFIEGEKHYRSYMNLNEKYNSLYLKSPAILEFRLFSSTNDTDDLIEYIETSTKLIKNGYIDYINNVDEITMDLQKLNFKSRISYDILFSYKGNLYKQDKDFPIYKPIKSKKITDLKIGLERIFVKRNQEFINVTKGNSNYYKIETLYEGSIYIYRMKINPNFTVEINMA